MISPIAPTNGTHTTAHSGEVPDQAVENEVALHRACPITTITHATVTPAMIQMRARRGDAWGSLRISSYVSTLG